MSMAPVTLVANTASKWPRSMSTSALEHAEARVVHEDVEWTKRLEDLAIRPFDVRLAG